MILILRKIISLHYKFLQGGFLFFLFFSFIFPFSAVRAEQPVLPAVQTSGGGLVSKVAPGEFLPVAVKLLNFGSNWRVDTVMTYEIRDGSGRVVYSANETVAVETTASFVKTIQIPAGTPSGRYVVRSSIAYQDQIVPATSEFPFTVERKMLGLFQSEFYFYGGITLVVSVGAGILGHLWLRRQRRMRFAPLDYSDLPRRERIFYELVSDTIAQMRQHVGDQALAIAENIEGLVIEGESGRILKLKKSPAKIVGALIQEYEKSLGQKVSFALPRGGQSSTRVHDDKNLVVINKYS